MSQPKHDDANTQQPIMFALLLIKQNFFANQLKWKTPKHDSVWSSSVDIFGSSM